jgi:hypothetical protein
LSKSTRNILVVIVAGVVLTCGCLLCAVAFAPNDRTPNNSPTSEVVENTDVPESTDVPPTVTTSPAGSTRDLPLPRGTTLEIGGDIVLVVADVVRPADDIVETANSFNVNPESNQEYIQVTVVLNCQKDASDKCLFTISSLQAVGADGNVIDPSFGIVGIEGELESGEFFGGSTRTGKLFYLVPKGDSSVVLFYDPFIGDLIYLGI